MLLAPHLDQRLQCLRGRIEIVAIQTSLRRGQFVKRIGPADPGHQTFQYVPRLGVVLLDQVLEISA